MSQALTWMQTILYESTQANDADQLFIQKNSHNIQQTKDTAQGG